MENETFFDEYDIRPVVIGDMIPDLELAAFHNEEVKKIRLRDHKGKWVILFFYPSDFTFICPTELEEMAQHYEEFKKLNAEVLSVSTDGAYVHKAWHDTSEAVKKITFPMLADPSGKLARAMGVYIEPRGRDMREDEGMALRGTFLFDPSGALVGQEIHANNFGRSAGELLRKLQAAIFVCEHGGQVCPASWQPGEKTLTPGVDLVGKI